MRTSLRSIMSDSEIESISMENLDIDDIKSAEIVEDIKTPKKSVAVSIGLPILILGLLLVLIFSVIQTAMTSVVVEGDVQGAKLSLAGYSIVDKDYNPNVYLKQGYTIYYDGNEDGFFKPKSSYSVGVITRVNDGTCYVDGTLKDIPVKYGRINYVVG